MFCSAQHPPHSEKRKQKLNKYIAYIHAQLFAPDLLCLYQPRGGPECDTEKEKWILFFTWYVQDASSEILLPPNAGMRYFNITVISCSTIRYQ